jgi:hypothetical protein
VSAALQTPRILRSFPNVERLLPPDTNPASWDFGEFLGYGTSPVSGVQQSSREIAVQIKVQIFNAIPMFQLTYASQMTLTRTGLVEYPTQLTLLMASVLVRSKSSLLV